MGLMDYLLEQVRGKPEPKKRRDDINLPDDKLGKPIARSLATRYADPHIVKGGDEDDPRWIDYHKRLAESNESKGYDTPGNSIFRSNAKRESDYNKKYIRGLFPESAKGNNGK